MQYHIATAESYYQQDKSGQSQYFMSSAIQDLDAPTT